MNKLDIYLDNIIKATEEKTLLKITLGSRKEKKSEVKNVFIKPVRIKENDMLSFVYRYPTNDITKNLNLADSLTTLRRLLKDNFFNADLYATTHTIYYTADNTGKEKIVTKQIETTLKQVDHTHDKQKQRIISPDAIYLKELGITTTDGVVKASMQHKYKQINRYVEIIDGIIKDEKIETTFSVVDMGSGKGYLTFALYDYFQNKKINASVIGVEMRPDLVNKCNNIASLSAFTQLKFTEGSIEATKLDDTDMLIALHACDTATDDSIAKGIKANAKFIICAPCCHKQIRKQMQPSNALKHITKHGILLERQAEMVTDTIRALILEANGYKTKVFDFIEEEDTPKNVMIVGRKSIASDSVWKENMEKVTALKEMFGIKEHYLETRF
jgi:SAM-dependent methyltransferase